MPKSKEEQEQQAQGKKKSGRGKLILALLGVFILAAGLTFGYLWFFSPVASAKTPQAPEILNFDAGEKVLNLADEGANRYLRVHTVLEYKKDEKLTKELEANQAQIIEKIILVLRSKTSEQVSNVKNTEAVKKEMLQSINSGLKQGKIDRIYFTDFLIQ